MDYESHILELSRNKVINVQDEVVVLVDYSLVRGIVLKTNPKSIKVKLYAQSGLNAYEKSCKPEKVLKVGHPAVLVWECWKGVNGRGGYRLDTIMYEDLWKPVEMIRPSTYLCETEFGEVSELSRECYLGK